MTVRFHESDASTTIGEITEFERRVQAALPAELRALLLQHNGGRVEPRTFRIRGESSAIGVIQRFLSVARLEEKWDAFKGDVYPRMPPEHVPIAICEGGDYLTLVADGPERGKVFLWSHEEEGDETYTYDNLYLVADSLDDLLAGLFTDPAFG